MSEQQKQDVAKIAEAMNVLPEKEQDRLLDFIQGAAFVVAAQQKDGKVEA